MIVFDFRSGSISNDHRMRACPTNALDVCERPLSFTFNAPTMSSAQALTLTAGPGRAATDATPSVSNSAAMAAMRAMIAPTVCERSM